MRRRRRAPPPAPFVHQGLEAPRDLVVLLDGTMCALEPGTHSNIGLIYLVLTEMPASVRPLIHYQPGLRWPNWWRVRDVATGRGINAQIRRAYAFLAENYRPGDRIFLLGFSRGAFAVRSLAGVIDRVGLLKAEHAWEGNILELYRHYQEAPHAPAAREFAARHCHQGVEIEMVGVFDTVKALGLRLPLLWRVTEAKHSFHSAHLGARVRHGFHALALDETRAAFEPMIWETPEGWPGRVVQMWFRGCHGDIGGRTGDDLAGRGLSNIPLVWMLERLEARGMRLPPGWATWFSRDPAAPSIGTWHGWGRLFLIRRRRVVGMDPSERIHPTALGPAVEGELPETESAVS